MAESIPPRISLDDLVLRVRKEAEALASEMEPEPIPHLRPVQVPLVLPEVTGDDWQPLLHHGAVAIVDLLAFTNEEFIDATYRAVLGRSPDAGGRDGLRRELVAGAPRLELIVRLRLSEEGRHFNRHLQGWSPLYQIASVLRPRHYGRRMFRRLEERVVGRSSALALPVAQYASRQFLTFAKVLEDVAGRRMVEQEARLRAVEQRVAKAVDLVGEADRMVRLNRRDFLYAELRGKAGGPAAQAGRQSPAVVSQESLDAYYVAFEDANRGTCEEVRAKQMCYVEMLKGELDGLRHLPVLDIGCGRGEWIRLIGEHGFAAKGVDLNPVMVEFCRRVGLDAECQDILRGLAGMKDSSVAAITSFHVIEHLPFPVLFAALHDAWRVLAPGGMLILETPNPENLLVGSHTFYHDFTHRNPVTPAALTFLVTYLNYADVRVERLNPYPESEKVPGYDLLTERVNGHLCGPQDFAVIARKPKLDCVPGEA